MRSVRGGFCEREVSSLKQKKRVPGKGVFYQRDAYKGKEN